jgi:rRNA maturation RNase YbeY
MITFNYETDFNLPNTKTVANWIKKTIINEGFTLGKVNYIFCDDDYLLSINEKFLNHNTLTDIISFDYTIDKIISGDIYISVERVKENSNLYSTSFDNELNRVMIHGILHYCGYKDKDKTDKQLMRSKEDYYLSLQNKK